MQLKNKWATLSFSVPQKSHLTSTSEQNLRKRVLTLLQYFFGSSHAHIQLMFSGLECQYVLEYIGQFSVCNFLIN